MIFNNYFDNKYFITLYVLYIVFLFIYVVLLLGGVNIKSVGNFVLSSSIILLGSIMISYLFFNNIIGRLINAFTKYNLISNNIWVFSLYTLITIIYLTILIIPQLIVLINESSKQSIKVLNEKLFNSKIKDSDINDLRLYKSSIYLIPLLSFIFLTIFESRFINTTINEGDFMQYLIISGILLLINSGNISLAIEYGRKLKSYLYINL